MSGYTKRQYETLRFIQSFIAEHGYSPSYEEIRVGTERTSKADVHRCVHALVERGAITLLPDRPRSIALPERA